MDEMQAQATTYNSFEKKFKVLTVKVFLYFQLFLFKIDLLNNI